MVDIALKVIRLKNNTKLKKKIMRIIKIESKLEYKSERDLQKWVEESGSIGAE